MMFRNLVTLLLLLSAAPTFAEETPAPQSWARSSQSVIRELHRLGFGAEIERAEKGALGKLLLFGVPLGQKGLENNRARVTLESRRLRRDVAVKSVVGLLQGEQGNRVDTSATRSRARIDAWGYLPRGERENSRVEHAHYTMTSLKATLFGLPLALTKTSLETVSRAKTSRYRLRLGNKNFALTPRRTARRALRSWRAR